MSSVTNQDLLTRIKNSNNRITLLEESSVIINIEENVPALTSNFIIDSIDTTTYRAVNYFAIVYITSKTQTFSFDISFNAVGAVKTARIASLYSTEGDIIDFSLSVDILSNLLRLKLTNNESETLTFKANRRTI